MKLTDEELTEEVVRKSRLVPGVDVKFQARLAPDRAWVLRQAVERFPESHIAGALARFELNRQSAVRLITLKNVAALDLEDGMKFGLPEEKIADLQARFEVMQAQVDEIKEQCKHVEINAREVTAKWLEKRDEGRT